MQTIELPDVEMKADFQPHAVLDVHLDCIRVLTRDTSVCEVRLGQDFTIFRDNFPFPGGAQYVGFSLKGINHILNDIGFDVNATYRVSEIIDAIVKRRPASTMAVFLDMFKDRMSEVNDSEIDLSVREAA